MSQTLKVWLDGLEGSGQGSLQSLPQCGDVALGLLQEGGHTGADLLPEPEEREHKQA